MLDLHALSFDLDGTIYPINRRHILSLMRDEKDWLYWIFGAREAIRTRVLTQGPFLEGESELLQFEAEWVSLRAGVSVAIALGRLEVLHKKLAHTMTEFQKPYPGLMETLQQLSRKGLKLALLTDLPVHNKLVNLGISEDIFEVILSTQEIGTLKPHVRAFEVLAERLEIEDPKQIVHLGDSEKTDVQGALGAGLRAFRFVQPGTLSSFIGRRTAAEARVGDFKKLRLARMLGF